MTPGTIGLDIGLIIGIVTGCVAGFDAAAELFGVQPPEDTEK